MEKKELEQGNLLEQYNQVTPSEVLEVQKKEAQEMLHHKEKGFSDFLKLKKGINKLKLFPAHIVYDAENKPVFKPFMMPKGVHWLPLNVWKDEKKQTWRNPTEEQIKEKKLVQTESRMPVFNARIHGIADADLVETYIKVCDRVIKSKAESIADKAEKQKVLDLFKIVTNYKSGIPLQTSWIAYAKDDEGHYGRFEATNGGRDQLNAFSLRKGISNEPIITDIYSHPLTGKPFSITYNPDSEDKKKTYIYTLLFDEVMPITEEEMKLFVEATPLDEIYGKNAFKRIDLMKQFQGLENFDRLHSIGAFMDSELQDTFTKLSELYPENNEETNTTESGTADIGNTPTPPIVEDKKISEAKEATKDAISEQKNPLEVLTKPQLLEFVKFHKLIYESRPLFSKERLVKDITEILSKEMGASIDQTFFLEVKALVDDFSANNSKEKEEFKDDKSDETIDEVEALKKEFSNN